MKQNAIISRRMRKKRKLVFIILLCVLLLLAGLAVAAWLYSSSDARVWVDGRDITLLEGDDYTMAVGGGTAQYDPDTRTLTLTNVTANRSARGAAVYSMGDITIVFEGENVLSGDKYGVYARGKLVLTGENSAEISGGRYGLYARNNISVGGHASLTVRGGEEAVRALNGWVHTDPLFLYLNEAEEVMEHFSGERYVYFRATVRLSYATYGGGEIPEAEFRYGERNLSLSIPTREGFTFRGWYTGRDFEVEFDASAPMVEDVTIHALWEKQADRVLTGIDVSGHQEEIDWEQVAASGVEFAVIRAGFRGYGETGSLNRDEYFDVNLAAARENGILAGIYFYSQATTPEEAVEEAEFVLEILGESEIDLPVFYDMEYAEDAFGYVGRFYDAHLSAEEKAALCQAFCGRINEAGYDAMVYANVRLLSEGLGAELEELGIGVWLAHWQKHTYYDRDYSFRQYTASGAVLGIEGGVDMNEWYVLYDELPEGLALPEAED